MFSASELADAQKGASPSWKTLEKRGDYFFSKAKPSFQKAVESWAQVERQALRLGSTQDLERARLSQAQLYQVLDLAEKFDSISKAHQLKSVSPLATSLSSQLSEAEQAEFSKSIPSLVTYFSKAGRAYFRAPDRIDRDLPILFEALAFSYRLKADLERSKADKEYLEALKVLSKNPQASATESLARLKIIYKLRDFKKAQQEFVSLEAKRTSFSREELLELLRLGRSLARYRGDRESFKKLNAELIKLGDTKGDQSAIQIGLRDFVRGTPAELVNMAKTFIQARKKLVLTDKEKDLCLYLAAQASMEVGQPASASQLLKQMEVLPQRSPWFQARVSAQVALALQNQGDYEAARGAYKDALHRMMSLSKVDHFKEKLRLNLAGVHLQLGDFQAAKAEAQSLLKTSKSREFQVASRLILGDCLYFASARSELLRKRNLNDALSTYQLAHREIGAIQFKDLSFKTELETQIKIHAGNVYRELSLLAGSKPEASRLRQQAIDAANAAYQLASKGKSPRLEMVSGANLAELYLEAGRPADANKLAQWALGRAKAQGHFESRWRAHWYLARISDALKNSTEADQHYQLAAQTIEAQRSRILDSDRKSGFMSNKQSFFEDLVRHYFERGQVQLAFHAAERSRSRAFIESLGLRFLLYSREQDRHLYNDYIKLLGRAEAVREGRSSLYGLKDHSRETYESLRSQIEALRNRIAKHPSVSQLVKSLVLGQPATLSEIQKGLSSTELLLEYFSTGERLVAFIISRNHFETVELTVKPSDLTRTVDAFLGAAAADTTIGEQLYRELVVPVEAKVESLSRGLSPSGKTPEVTIVPWGPLHRLPFEALVSSKRGFLIEKWELSYLPSATVLKYLPRDGDQGAPQQLVALVDPDTDYNGDGKRDFPHLPYAQIEVEGIAKLFKDKVVLSGKNAEESRGTQLASSGHVVHLACHGEFFPARPMDSTLYLTRGQNADGKLRASEILGLNLKQSRLITLSGCETGRYDVGPGDDPVGLGTAFLHSGARSLLVSLWKVEDEATAGLMEKFYTRWLKGSKVRRSQALREAKLDMLREGKFKKPNQWASFILIGIR